MKETSYQISGENQKEIKKDSIVDDRCYYSDSRVLVLLGKSLKGFENLNLASWHRATIGCKI